MEFNCTVNVIDAIMGAGKTQSIMNYINSTDDDEKILVITPFLEEVSRYKDYCKCKKFKEPIFKSNETKFSNIKKLINSGENIVSTHAMFQKFDNELIDLCRVHNYTLVMDEVANVIDDYTISKEDTNTLLKDYCDVNPDTKQLIWREEFKNYVGKFENEKKLCELGSLVLYGNSLMVWLFPIEVFNSFRKIYILTYRFDLQFQKYYYDYYGLQYKFWSVSGDDLDNYHMIEYDENKKYTDHNYKSLIHICENEKLNMIGDTNYALSSSWYDRNLNNFNMTVLKNNLTNFFRNIRTDNAKDNLWTTFDKAKSKLKGKGYTKGYLACNMRAINTFRDRSSVAYTINMFMDPYVKNFFTSNGIEVDEDGYALSEMLQFIWRSAIRDGKEILVYIPSIRMRNLLKQWIEENSTNK